jgi:RepB DNA-primase from phage plasmid
MNTPNLTMAHRFLDLIAPGEAITFQTFADAKSSDGRMARVLHGSLDLHAVELTRLNQAGAGIFFMVNAGDGVVHEGSKTCRTARNVLRVRAHFVDLDGAPLDPVLSAAIPPQIAVESSPLKYHAYWRVADCELAAFTPVQKALALEFSGDLSVNDLPRVLRLPGFWHQKAKPFMSRILIPQELS